MASVDRTRGHSLRLHQESGRLDVRWNFFREMIVKCWNWLPREEVESLSLQVLEKAGCGT